MEFFKYLIDLLKERGCGYVKVFGGGGGVIVPDEIRELEAYGVSKIYSPDDGKAMGLKGMISHMMVIAAGVKIPEVALDMKAIRSKGPVFVGRLISTAERARFFKDKGFEPMRAFLKVWNRRVPLSASRVPVARARARSSMSSFAGLSIITLIKPLPSSRWIRLVRAAAVRCWAIGYA